MSISSLSLTCTPIVGWVTPKHTWRPACAVCITHWCASESMSHFVPDPCILIADVLEVVCFTSCQHHVLFYISISTSLCWCCATPTNPLDRTYAFVQKSQEDAAATPGVGTGRSITNVRTVREEVLHASKRADGARLLPRSGRRANGVYSCSTLSRDNGAFVSVPAHFRRSRSPPLLQHRHCSASQTVLNDAFCSS